MKNVLNQILTGKDNQTHDFVRWLGVLVVPTALCLTVYGVVWKGYPFDLEKFGAGMGYVFGSLGICLKLKESTEP